MINNLANTLGKTVVVLSMLLALAAFKVDATYTLEKTYQKYKAKYPELQHASEAATELTVWKAQTYKTLGELKLGMDVYARADQQGLKPAVLLVHGGGWIAGSRDLYQTLAGRLAEKGYIVASVSYRLSPQAKYPAAVHDVRDSLRWLRLHAGKYGIDPERIFIGGGSAGGQIASLVGLTTGSKHLDLHVKSQPELGRVSGIINIDGLSSFVVPLALKHENDPKKKPSAAEAWFGGRYEQVPELWQQASPLTHVSKQAPPMLFIKSSRLRFSAGIEEMQASLKQHGVYHKVTQLAGSPHSFWLFEPWMTETVDMINAFLQELENMA
ncbi:Acetyl esterase/lipase [Alteromonadaceae bacterium Bs31]|nr:Acetyl esterase/lipase [Alteromonadaceae bacterium Bs31]